MIRRLGWWAADYAYAAIWQVRAYFNTTDPRDFQSGSGRPVVIIPGIYETWKFMQPLVRSLHERGHPVHVIVELRRNRRPIAEGADHLSHYLVLHDLTDVTLVAHSKGGLIGKQVMVAGPAMNRVTSMLAVATPFNGSWLSRFMVLPSLRAFSPSDDTIRHLNRATEVNTRIVSAYGVFDPHIPGGSALVAAENVVLDTGGHFRVLADPRVIAEAIQLAR